MWKQSSVPGKYGELTSREMAHPFHIHGASFRILSHERQKPPAHQTGWKDTALIDGKAEILVHISTVKRPAAHPFMFHCHLLEHEDAWHDGAIRDRLRAQARCARLIGP